MTNKEYLLSDDRRLAKSLINIQSEPDYDYDYDDEVYCCGTIDYLLCPDGERFGCGYIVDNEDWEEAIDYVVKWLHKESED